MPSSDARTAARIVSGARELLVAAGKTGEALRGLDEGVKRLGPLVVLESRALDLELRQTNYDGALLRIQSHRGCLAAQGELAGAPEATCSNKRGGYRKPNSHGRRQSKRGCCLAGSRARERRDGEVAGPLAR